MVVLVQTVIYHLKIPQHVELLLAGSFAVIQPGENSSAGIHQATVAVVLVRFDSPNEEMAAEFIIAVLRQTTRIIKCENKPVCLCVQ